MSDKLVMEEDMDGKEETPTLTLGEQLRAVATEAAGLRASRITEWVMTFVTASSASMSSAAQDGKTTTVLVEHVTNKFNKGFGVHRSEEDVLTAEIRKQFSAVGIQATTRVQYDPLGWNVQTVSVVVAW